MGLLQGKGPERSGPYKGCACLRGMGPIFVRAHLKISHALGSLREGKGMLAFLTCAWLLERFGLKGMLERMWLA